MSVCSERFTHKSGFPIALARFSTVEVLPTPGGPSSKIGFRSWIPRKILRELSFVASKLKFGFGELDG
jgi:hypothetical protein